MSFTAVYVEAEDGWIVGYVEEIIGAHAQGITIEETRRNLRDSLALMIGDNRERNRESFKGYRVIRKERILPAF
ncbi:MAG: type II toxin-antitoxin system HicB family antitoxin [Acidobacteriota bacterium]